jgi:peptidyl-dipeptidase A
MSDPAAVADEIEERLRPLSIAAANAWWDANVHADEETERRRVETEIARTDLLADGELFAAIEAARASGEGGGDLHARRLDLLHHAFLPNQVPGDLRRRIVELEASVEGRYARHRGEVAGRPVDDNEIKRILRTSDDPAERREAWEASKTIGAAVADDVRELARLRNKAAAAVGARDFFALSLTTSELDEDRLFETLEEAERLTAPPFTRWKRELDARLAERFGCSPSDLRPWHYDDPFFQEVPVSGGVDLDPVFAGRDLLELTRSTFDGIDLRTEEILERSDLFPREGKCQHAFCIDVDRAGDVRVLANVVADQYWMDTMLHELGHGVYDVGIDPALPWLLRSTHLVTTEGIALMFGRLSADADWLERVAGVDAADAAALAGPLRAARAAELAVFARWVLVMTHFERGLYADPEGDHDARWWELVGRFQLVTPPDDRRAPDWAAKIHVAVAPVYYHTYLYGQLVASQLRSTIDGECGGLVGSPGAGAFLTERIFRPGAAIRWDRLLELATGEPLTAAHFARELEPLEPAATNSRA